MVCPASRQPRLDGGVEVGFGDPHRAGDRELGHRLGRLDDIDNVRGEAEAVAHVGHRDDDAAPRGRVEDHAHGILAIPDAQGMDLDARAGVRQRGAHLEHVGAQDHLGALDEVVGVVLHERGAAGQPLPHDLRGAHENRSLPVPLGAEAIAGLGQALHGQAGELTEPAEVLEVGREGLRPALLEEGTQRNLLAGGVAQRFRAIPTGGQLGGHVVALAVFGHEGIDGPLVHGINDGHEVVDRPRVDRDAEATLSLGLVTLRDCHVAHVVAEAHDAQLVGRRETTGRAHPVGDAATRVLLRGMTDHGGASQAQARQDVRVFAVPVRRLVQVHEVHVDAVPRNFDIGLGRQV